MHVRTSITAYIAITLSCMAGLLHLSPWFVVLSACGLTLISILRKHDAAMVQLGSTTIAMQTTLLGSSAINAGIISAGGYVFGIGTGWFWGVS
jgi:hypothetical protein